jgi:hypothetical protein
MFDRELKIYLYSGADAFVGVEGVDLKVLMRCRLQIYSHRFGIDDAYVRWRGAAYRACPKRREKFPVQN